MSTEVKKRNAAAEICLALAKSVRVNGLYEYHLNLVARITAALMAKQGVPTTDEATREKMTELLAGAPDTQEGFAQFCERLADMCDDPHGGLNG